MIDNASTDGTAELARAAGAEVVAEPRKGKGYAVQRLFSLTESDYLIMVDGDDTYPAEEALKLIAAVEREGGDTVVGRRTSNEQAAFKTTHTWANLALTKLIETLFSSHSGDLFSGYRLFTRAFYRNIPDAGEGVRGGDGTGHPDHRQKLRAARCGYLLSQPARRGRSRS